VRSLAQELFDVLDTDSNNLIDGIEVLSMLSVLSGMNKEEMLEFNLSLCDFNNTATLSFDELVLAIKATSTGVFLGVLHINAYTNILKCNML
jgi:Ca2+-binding EF-hand superfamily protein